MNTNDTIAWLRDQAIRAPEDVLKRGLNQAADKLEELQTELKAEMYRHDRLQDFEVAEAEELRKLKTQLAKDTNVLTNADRIRAMSDEELAAMLADDERVCPPIHRRCHDYVDVCNGCWMEWLQKPATKNEN